MTPGGLAAGTTDALRAALAEGAGLVYLLPSVYALGGAALIVSGVDVTLEGLGGEAVIDAQGLSRAIDVNGGGRLTLRRLAVVGGSAESGGCVRVHGAGSSLLMDASSLRACTATGTIAFGTGGGGLAVLEHASAELTAGSTITECTAGETGGGVWTDQGNLTLQGASRIEHCTSVRGGALMGYDSDIAMMEGSVVSGHATYIGGGMSAPACCTHCHCPTV